MDINMKKLNGVHTGLPTLVGEKNRRTSLTPIVKDPKLASIISKVTADPKADKTGTQDLRSLMPNKAITSQITDAKMASIKDTRNIWQLLPDIALCARIVVSSILSPVDMITTELIFNSENDLLPPELNSTLNNILHRYNSQTYRLEEDLYDITENMLYRTGAEPRAVIPESSLDEMINGEVIASFESISKKLNIQPNGDVERKGLVGPSDFETQLLKLKKGEHNAIPALEALFINRANAPAGQYDFSQPAPEGLSTEEMVRYKLRSNLVIIDNHEVLKIPKLTEVISRRAQAERSGLKTGREHLGGIQSLENHFVGKGTKLSESDEMRKRLFQNNNRPEAPFKKFKTEQQTIRKSIGDPTIMTFPTESVIPVYLPGDPSKQVGFYLILDQDYQPLTLDNSKDSMRDMQNRFTGDTNKDTVNGSETAASNLLEQTRQSMLGSARHGRGANAQAEINRLSELMMEEELVSALTNGLGGSGFTLARAPEIGRMMLKRTFASEKTICVYIPEALMTYFAFEYDAYGLGKSLLEDSRLINSIRAIALFVNTQAALLNAVGETEYRIKLDPDDPTPVETIALIEEVISEKRQSGNHLVPFGVNDSSDIIDWLPRVGVSFTFEGNTRIPDMSIDKSVTTQDQTTVDQELIDRLDDLAIMNMGLTPELIDTAKSPDFAIGHLTQNVLLTKRIMRWQDKLMPQVTDHIYKVCIHTPAVMSELEKTINANLDSVLRGMVNSAVNKKEFYLAVRNTGRDAFVRGLAEKYLLSMTVTLPRPVNSSLENQQAVMEAYATAVDYALTNAYIPDSMFNESSSGEKQASEMDKIRATWKAYLLRKKMQEIGMLPEVAALFTKDETGNPSYDLVESQLSLIESGTGTFNNYLDRINIIGAGNKRFAELKGLDTSDDYSSSDDSSSSGDASSEGDTGDSEPSSDDIFDMDFDLDSMPGLDE